MSFIHCHKCKWEQDDFYSEEGYNPAKYLKGWNIKLLSDDIDSLFSMDKNFLKKNGCVSNREVIAREYEKFANRIRKMRWITYEQWKKDPNKICPECGSKDLDID